MIKLYVIDDHHLIVEGLYSTFNLESDEFTVVGGSLTIADAIEKIFPDNVDIIILDLFINHTDPISNLKQIHNKFPTLPVVILSYENCLIWQVKMFKNGIKAYISKIEDKSVMAQKLHRVFAGEIVMPSDVGQILISEDDVEQSPQPIISGYMEIIKDLANGLSIKEIAVKLNQSESAIDKKLQKIRQCFHVNTNYELIYKAFIKHTPHSHNF